MSLDLVLRSDEKAVFSLRTLYGKYGYSQYKMSKFEEYDLYVRNKDFLVSDNIITFTDTDGKLMALKPDVTLSIIKNGKDNPDRLQKVFYNENVYRVSKGTKSFKEFMQVGLECLGDVDDYAVTEVLTLAVKSLETVSPDYVLDVSSLDVVKSVLDGLDVSLTVRKEIIRYLSEKNVQGIETVCLNNGVADSAIDTLKTMVRAYGSPEKVKKEFAGLTLTQQTRNSLDKLFAMVSALESTSDSGKINVDFSVVNNMNYYNGIVFKGFISGIPTGILSGGQYDNLMEKMGKKSKGVGFAVYLDELLRLSSTEEKFDVDVALEYGNADVKKVSAMVKEIIDGGETVLAEKVIPEKLKYKRIIKL